jgi:hypothetical protein
MSSQNRDNEEDPSCASLIIIMQEPNEEVEASIPPLNVRDDPDLNRTFTARRKAAKRTLPWDLKSGELELVSSQLPQFTVSAFNLHLADDHPISNVLVAHA